jgi:transcriptional regulator with XRE-family HTH domain
MGRNSRIRPNRLAEKLKQIREALGLSQDEMLTRLNLDKTEGLERSVISAFELNKREPSLDVILAYGRVANVYVEVLIDDEIDLPEVLPATTKSEGNKK